MTLRLSLVALLLALACFSLAWQQQNFNQTTITNATLVTPTVSGLTNGTGLQVFTTATTCTTAATISTPCTTASINLPVGYADTNYRIVCNGLAAVTAFPQIQTITKSNTSFTITLNNLTAAAASYGAFDCIAAHN